MSDGPGSVEWGVDQHRAAPVDPATSVDQIIRARRTSLLVDPAEEVPPELIAHLLELATWAPNHKRTWPWRFTVLADDARYRFGEALAAVAGADGSTPPEKVAKTRIKYARAAAVVLVWVRCEGDALRQREDRDAVAAAVQTLLLAATSFGLASYWASLAEDLTDPARRFAGLDPDHDLVGLVYLGWPTGSVAAPPRPEPEVTWLS
jgi:nitroreductase